MRAALCKQYGSPDVISVETVSDPIPKDKEVLIKVIASTVNSGDWRIRSLDVPAGYGPMVRLAFGFLKPRKPIFGTELSGEIVACGDKVTKFQVGDQVIASIGFQMGAHAELVTVKETDAIVKKPAGLGFNEAAALSFGGITALYFLQHKGKIQAGEPVLINGASGTVGTAAIQIAKHFGAEVTAVSSEKNHELLRSLGADHLIDYKNEDFKNSGESWDIIMDNVGTIPVADALRYLNDSGRFLMIVAGFKDNLLAPWTTRNSGRRVITGTAAETGEDLQYLVDLAGNGEYKPVIDSVYTLENIREAHSRVDSGRKVGSVVVTMDQAG